jgi:2-C-methyl-D-erythritol 2,4-cyclodiphosphate synthase
MADLGTHGQTHAPFRIGHGYDLHRLEPRGAANKSLIVGGVPLDGPGPAGVELGVVAHSDGDVLLHAATDALLGALGLPDIGQLFPDHAPENAGRDSRDFVREAARRAAGLGWRVGNLDATVVLEKPRLGAHKDKMRAVLAECLGVGVEAVNVKGKSHERVDAIGEGRAIECQVVVVLVRAGVK